MKARLRKHWDTLRSSYWFVPALMTMLVVLLWAGTSWLDRALAAGGAAPAAWLYTDDRDAMRTLLLAVAGAIIGIVGVVFSITMVPLTIATAQFGPRLLRTFLRDTGTQLTLGTFVATFIFCMLVLLGLRDEAAQPTPQISMTAALLLALASFTVLIYFINHVAISIQAPIVVAEVSAELHATIDRELPQPLAEAAAPDPRAANEAQASSAAPARAVAASASGYVQARDDDQLVRIAADHNLVIQLLGQPGDFVVEATPLALVWPAALASQAADAAINAAHILGPQRTLVQDITFGFNELVEMAIRALSPAINDPFTAITCLDWIGTALCRVCPRAFPPSTRHDEHGRVRLLMNALTFTQLADAAFNQIREYGRTNTAVMLRMLDTIAAVAQCARTAEQRAALLQHATLAERASASGLPEAADRQAVAARYHTVAQLLETRRHAPVPNALRDEEQHTSSTTR